MIVSAFCGLFFPRSIENSGAPPLPNKLLNAVMITISGKHRPTAPSAAVPTSGIREGGCAAARDTGDIDTIYDVIEQVQNLGNQHGERCP